MASVQFIISSADARKLKRNNGVFACETLDQAGRRTGLHVVIGHGYDNGKLDRLAFEAADRLDYDGKRFKLCTCYPQQVRKELRRIGARWLAGHVIGNWPTGTLTALYRRDGGTYTLVVGPDHH